MYFGTRFVEEIIVLLIFKVELHSKLRIGLEEHVWVVLKSSPKMLNIYNENLSPDSLHLKPKDILCSFPPGFKGLQQGKRALIAMIANEASSPQPSGIVVVILLNSVKILEEKGEEGEVMEIPQTAYVFASLYGS